MTRDEEVCKDLDEMLEIVKNLEARHAVHTITHLLNKMRNKYAVPAALPVERPQMDSEGCYIERE